MAGAVLRGDPDEFRVSDGVTWGLGASFPSRSRLRALVEWQGEFVIKDNTLVINAAVRRRGRQHRAAPEPDFRSDQHQGRRRVAGVERLVRARGRQLQLRHRQAARSAGFDIDHNSWGFDVRVGWHPGVTPHARARPRDQGDDDGHQHRDAAAAGRRGAAAESLVQR